MHGIDNIECVGSHLSLSGRQSFDRWNLIEEKVARHHGETEVH